MIVSYRKGDYEEPEKKPKKAKLYNNRAYIEALKEKIIRDHNEKIKARDRSRAPITIK